MTPNLSAIAAEVATLQLQAQRAQTRFDNISAQFAAALALRPAGIDPEWLPDFTLSAGQVTVRAWFDPTFFGKRLNVR